MMCQMEIWRQIKYSSMMVTGVRLNPDNTIQWKCDPFSQLYYRLFLSQMRMCAEIIQSVDCWIQMKCDSPVYRAWSIWIYEKNECDESRYIFILKYVWKGASLFDIVQCIWLPSHPCQCFTRWCRRESSISRHIGVFQEFSSMNKLINKQFYWFWFRRFEAALQMKQVRMQFL